MKQKLYLLIAAFLMLSFYAISQSSLTKQVQPYFGQTGIKKKISELKAVKEIARKLLDPNRVIPLKSYFQEKDPKTIKLLTGNKVFNSGDDREDEANATKALRAPSTAVSATTTPQVWSNFLSTDFTEYPHTYPPDPNGAVGATQVIVASNIGLKVYDKPAVTDLPVVTPTGYSQEKARSTLFITLNQFFSPLLARLSQNSYAGDVHIRYDRLTKRWFVVAIEINPPSYENNEIFLAVSDGDRVTDSSSFTYYSFKSSIPPFDNNALLDFPRLGVDKNSVLIGGNQFGPDSLTNIGYVINKKKLIHGDLVVYPFELGVVNFKTEEVKGIYTPQGVYNDDPTVKKSFFAGVSYYYDGGLLIRNIEYDKKNKPQLASENTVQVEPTVFPRQNSAPGGLAPIAVPDIRLLAAAIHKNKLTGNSSLWTAHHIGVDHSGSSENLLFGSDSNYINEARTASRWYKIGNIYTKPALLQSGTVYDGSKLSGRRAVQYFYPSIATSGQGHSIISGTTDAYNEYLNVFAAGRYFGDKLGTTSAPVKLTHTTAIYDLTFNFFSKRDTYRWGDYSQTVVDPLDDQTIWTFQEYADVDDSYGVRVVQFKAPPPATPASVGTLSNKTDNTVTLTGTSVDHSGFFDPGKDAGGPGYNRLSVRSTGNIIVSNIKFISPTKISFTLNTKNKPAGQYLLIITNPDGQLVVTDFTLTANTSALIAENNSAAQRALHVKIAQAYIIKSQVFPNPTTKNVTLQIDAAKEHIAKIVLVNADGTQVFQRNYTFSKGSNQAVLPTEKFTRGTYIAAVYNSDNVLIATQKIVKQ